MGSAIRPRCWKLTAALAAFAAAILPHAAAADVTAADIESYLEERSTSWSWAPELAFMTKVLTRELRRGGVAAAGAEIARAWKIAPSAGEALAEALIIEDMGHDPEVPYQDRQQMIEAAIARALDRAPDSVEVWASAQHLWSFDDGCQNPAHVERFFARAWAPEAYLAGRANGCEGWIVELPRFAPLDSRGYRQLYWFTYDEPAKAAAASLYRESLRREGSTEDSPEAIDADRGYWLSLADLGLHRDILREADAMPPARLEALLVQKPEMRAGYASLHDDPAWTPESNPPQLQLEWIFSLVLEGRRTEAQAWLRRMNLRKPNRRASRSDRGPEEPVFAGEGADERALAWLVAAGDPSEDPFDLVIGDGERGLMWSGGTPSAISTRAIAGYLEAAGYADIAADVRAWSCYRDRSDRWSAKLMALPAAFRDAHLRFRKLVREFDASTAACGTPPSEANTPSLAPLRRQFVEIPLPPELRTETVDATESPDKVDVPGLGRFNIVRFDDRGELAAAISLSQAVDPVGEVSAGGYWVHLSDDGGRTWRPPFWLGLQQYVPYEIQPESKLALVRDGRLQVEVRVADIDARSISFPPVGLSVLREARDLYIEIPLDDIARDSDGDGLTDLLEDRFRTNPLAPDTDMDGIRDDRDSMPQVSIREPATALAPVYVKVLSSLGGYGDGAIIVKRIGEPESAFEDVVKSLLGEKRPEDRHEKVLFLSSPSSQFTGVSVPSRVIFVDDDDLRHQEDHYGLFYPLDVPVWFNRERTKAVVRWSAGWVGGTWFFEKDRSGAWKSQEVSSWIT